MGRITDSSVPQKLRPASSQPVRFRARIGAGRSAFTLVELLVVIAIIAILVSLLLPAVNAAREAARKAQCMSQIRQISLAMLNYESAVRSFPEGTRTKLRRPSPCNPSGSGFQNLQPGTTGGTSCSNGPSWTVLILPYVEEQGLYDQFDFKQPFTYLYDLCTGSTNHEPQMTPVSFLQCPSDPIAIPGTLHNNYFACMGGGDWAAPHPTVPEYGYACETFNSYLTFTNGITGYDTKTKFKKIKDGSSKTILIGENRLHFQEGANQNFSTRFAGWSSGFDVHPSFGIAHNAAAASRPINFTPVEGTQVVFVSPGLRAMEFGSHHPGGAHFSFADGSTRPLTEDIDLEAYWSLGRRADGGPLGGFE